MADNAGSAVKRQAADKAGVCLDIDLSCDLYYIR